MDKAINNENSNVNISQVQVINHNHTVVPFEWAAQKLFGPVLSDLGQDMVSIKRRLGKVVVSAMKKLKPSQENGITNSRVAWNVISEASFIDSEIGSEYFGGILASAKNVNGSDDTGIYYLQLAKSLSSKQLYLHYICYKSLNNLFLSDESMRTVNVGMGSELSNKKVYFLANELLILGVNIETDFQALSANGLIGQNWEVTEKDVTHPVTGIQSKIYQAFIIPTTLGIQMLAIAQNKLKEYRSITVSDFGSIENIELPAKYSFSLGGLLS